MLSNHFWYGFAIGVGIAFFVVLVPALIKKARKTGKE
jgi:hypothetical protein